MSIIWLENIGMWMFCPYDRSCLHFHPYWFNSSILYSDEWSELCLLADKGLSELQKYAVFMRLQGSRLRSIHWQLLLGSLPTTPSLWISILRQQRNSYRLLHQRLTVDPHRDNVDVGVDNPLSQSCVVSTHTYKKHIFIVKEPSLSGLYILFMHFFRVFGTNISVIKNCELWSDKMLFAHFPRWISSVQRVSN